MTTPTARERAEILIKSFWRLPQTPSEQFEFNKILSEFASAIADAAREATEQAAEIILDRSRNEDDAGVRRMLIRLAAAIREENPK